VIVKNFLSNIRITTLFAGESEVKIVDPSRISEVRGFVCKVEFIPPDGIKPVTIFDISC